MDILAKSSLKEENALMTKEKFFSKALNRCARNLKSYGYTDFSSSASRDSRLFWEKVTLEKGQAHLKHALCLMVFTIAVMPMIMSGLLMTVYLRVTTMPVPVIVPVIMPIALVVLLPRGMMSLAVVFHFGHISFVAIHVVGDSLDTTIGQLDVIFALGHFAIAMLIVAKVCAVIVVMDFVAVFVLIMICLSIGLAICLGSVVLAEEGKHYGHHDHHPAYYKYGYKVHDDYHGTDFGHNEHRDGHVTKGEYHVKLPDGRVQTVTYYVDGYKGYVAEVKYHGKAHHPAGKKHHKGYGHDHGHDHGHGHGGHSEVCMVIKSPAMITGITGIQITGMEIIMITEKETTGMEIIMITDKETTGMEITGTMIIPRFMVNRSPEPIKDTVVIPRCTAIRRSTMITVKESTGM
eukprot:maker-scaffold544_size141056-snap-gene-0.31 protein:Tk06758 transcript:maker-scaffold544_size141056-snap-gene-0.31-mRNA-1 annotation:"cutile protein "